MEKNIYMRRVSTDSTFDWVIRKIEKARSEQCVKWHLEEDKATLKRWLEKYTIFDNGEIRYHIAVGPKSQMPKCRPGAVYPESKNKPEIICMGHYFILYEYPYDIYREVPHLWVVTR